MKLWVILKWNAYDFYYVLGTSYITSDWPITFYEPGTGISTLQVYVFAPICFPILTTLRWCYCHPVLSLLSHNPERLTCRDEHKIISYPRGKYHLFVLLKVLTLKSFLLKAQMLKIKDGSEEVHRKHLLCTRTSQPLLLHMPRLSSPKVFLLQCTKLQICTKNFILNMMCFIKFSFWLGASWTVPLAMALALVKVTAQTLDLTSVIQTGALLRVKPGALYDYVMERQTRMRGQPRCGKCYGFSAVTWCSTLVQPGLGILAHLQEAMFLLHTPPCFMTCVDQRKQIQSWEQGPYMSIPLHCWAKLSITVIDKP